MQRSRARMGPSQRQALHDRGVAARRLSREEERNIRKEEADLNGFFKELELCKDLRVCNVCGEKRNAMMIPDKNAFHQDDHLFESLEEDELDKFCHEPDDEDDLVMCCLACLKYLKKGNRPPHAFKFPPVDEELLRLTWMEFRCVRPYIPFVTVYNAFGAEKKSGTQFVTKGQTANFYNPLKDTLSKIPRRPTEADFICVKSRNAQLSMEDLKVRPKLLARIALRLKQRHRYEEHIDLDDEHIEELREMFDDEESQLADGLLINSDDDDKSETVSECEDEEEDDEDQDGDMRQSSRAATEEGETDEDDGEVPGKADCSCLRARNNRRGSLLTTSLSMYSLSLLTSVLRTQC